MPAKPNSRNWNDVQTAIAAVAVVLTLGLWNLFAQPAKSASAQTEQPPIPPPSEPPAAIEPTAIPQVKIMFTQAAPQTVTTSEQQVPKKKKNKNNDGGGGGGTVTQTKSS